MATPQISSSYVEPGTYVKILKPQIPAIPSSMFVPAIVGVGKTTKDLVSAAIVKGSSADTQRIDAAIDDINSITQVIDSDNVIYRLTTDYLLVDDTAIPDGKDESIAWTPVVKATIVGVKVENFDLANLTFKMAIDGGAMVTHTFAVGFDGKTAAEVAIDLLTTFTSGVAITDDSGKVKIETVAIKGSILEIGDEADPADSSNSVLGFSVIKVYGSMEPAVDKKYYVTFNAPKTADDYDPVFIGDQTAIETVYGDAEEVDVNSLPVNTLSLGSRISKENGAGFIYACQVDTSNGLITGYQNAIDKLKEVTPWIIVPMLPISDTVNSELLAYIKAHVTQMSSVTENKYRTAILGAPRALDNKTDKPASMATYQTIFAALAFNRMPYIVPSKCQKLLGDNLIDLDGCYIAAAISGIATNPNYDAGEPLSGKDINGFSDINAIFLRNELNVLAGSGGMVIEKEGASIKIRHALTTDTSNAANQEFKVTKIVDFVFDISKKGLTSAFVNTRNITETVVTNMEAYQEMLLAGIKPNIINDSKDLTVAVSPVEPRQINVRFAIKPTLDVNWIYVEFGVYLA